MDKGYIENGFIVDLTTARKTSEIIYELSRVLDMPEAKGKHICLKLGSVDLSESELTSVKSLVELMESQLAFISTSSAVTLESATALGIKISEFTEQVEAPVLNLRNRNLKFQTHLMQFLEKTVNKSQPKTLKNQTIQLLKKMYKRLKTTRFLQ